MRDPRLDVGTALYELPAQIARLDAVRGTILALDWRVFRELGVYEAYAAALDTGHRDALLTATAGSWVPLRLLQEHYRALDTLALDEPAIRRVGRTVGEGVHGAFLATLLRLAGKLGVSPWQALEQCYKLWVRSWRGGAIAVHRAGERTARVTLLETPVCASRFFCLSFAEAMCASVEPFGKTPEAHVIGGSQSLSSVAFDVVWAA